MKNISLLLLLPACCLVACTATIEPPSQEPENEQIDLGYFSLAEESEDFTPYLEKSTLVFVDEAGQEYFFEMNAPVYRSSHDFVSTFDHPTDDGRQVDYRYQGERFIFDFQSNQLGAQMTVSLRPGLCSNPNLRAEGRVLDHLHIDVKGFNQYDLLARDPVMDVNIPARSLCTEGRLLPVFSYLGRSYEDVYYSERTYRGKLMGIYYNAEKGVVGIKTPYLFAILDRFH